MSKLQNREYQLKNHHNHSLFLLALLILSHFLKGKSKITKFIYSCSDIESYAMLYLFILVAKIISRGFSSNSDSFALKIKRIINIGFCIGNVMMSLYHVNSIFFFNSLFWFQLPHFAARSQDTNIWLQLQHQHQICYIFTQENLSQKKEIILVVVSGFGLAYEVYWVW